jgi:hypothetical protein
MRFQAKNPKGKSKHGGGACRRRRKLRRSGFNAAAKNTTDDNDAEEDPPPLIETVGQERPPPLVDSDDENSDDEGEDSEDEGDEGDEADETEEAAADDPTAGVRVIAQALNPTRISEESQAFLALGWTNWHMGFIGANKTEENTRELLRVVVKILMRIQNVAIDMDVVRLPPHQSVLDFFSSLVSKRVLHAALHRVMQEYTASLSSLSCHLYDLLEGLRWLKLQGGSSCKDKDFAAFDSLIRDSAKGVKRSVRKKKRLSDKSIATAVFNREYPARGLAELREMVEEDAKKIILLFGSDTNQPTITDLLYRHVLEVLYVGFWVTAPQGRIQGIETLKIKHVDEFEKKGYALNNEFKTSETFKYQPVLLSSITRSLLNIYLTWLRPSVSPKNAQPRPDDLIFLNFDGSNFTNISRLVSSYFRMKAGLKITTTTLRGIVETECARRRDCGEITEAQRTSISVIVGHGDKTAKDDYVRTDLDADVKRARLAFGVDMESVVVEESLPSLLPKVDEWGTDHPDRENTGRARWTTEEKEYLQSLADSLLAENNELYKDRIVSECLKRIKADRTTRRIFHARHILDGGRLRAGYRLLVGR